MLQRYLTQLEVKVRTVQTPTNTTQPHVQNRLCAAETAFLATKEQSHQRTKHSSEMHGFYSMRQQNTRQGI